ncbi:OmpA family protein [Leptospira interrogans]
MTSVTRLGLVAGLLSSASLFNGAVPAAAETSASNQTWQMAQVIINRGDEQKGDNRQERRGERQDNRQEKREDRRDNRQERRDDRKDARGERRDIRQDNKQEQRGVREERRDERKDVREERRDIRQDNRQEQRGVREERRDERKDVREERRDIRQDNRQEQRGVREERRDDRKDVRDDRREARGERRWDRMRLEDIKKERRERVEDGRRVIEEPDGRMIVREQGRNIIRHNEGERFGRKFQDRRVERRNDGVTVTTYIGAGGIHIVSEADSHGRLLRRYRRGNDGRMIVLIDNRRYHRPGVGGIFLGGFVDLRPPVIRIPRERYIVDYEDASYDDVYDALADGPIDSLERRYSLDEIRQTQYLRDRVRRVDLDSVNFEFGSWEVPPGQYGRLERVARAINRVLDRDPDAIFMVEGHTDAVGSDEDNLTLSDRRAESVAMILSDEFGVPPENLVTQGYGEQFLKVDTQAPEVINRRVAIRNISGLLSRSDN